MIKKYDVVVIGSGIGGLICACYLAKFGLKVLIVEQNDKPGGCCSSFQRNGYKFDVGVHYFAGIKFGILGTILDELKLRERISFNRIDPTDKIVMPDNSVLIRSNIEDTIEEFIKSFPCEEKQIKIFFSSIFKEDFFSIYKKNKRLTFEGLLDSFFDDYRLKATLGVLLGNLGLSPKIAASLPAIILLRKYLTDSGYYPCGGMQTFPNLLVKCFNENNGIIVFSKRVKTVSAFERIKKIILDNGQEVHADFVVSNGDASEFFKCILDKKSKESEVVDKLTPACSLFLAYLGISNAEGESAIGSAIEWRIPTYDINTIFADIYSGSWCEGSNYLIFSSPALHDTELKNQTKKSLLVTTFAPYKSKLFWEENKDKIGNQVLSRIFILKPELRNAIETKFFATPATLNRYTLNGNGSFVGWLSDLTQTKYAFLPQRTSIKGVYLVSHWCATGYSGQGGVSSVAFLGRRGAQLIMEDLQIKDYYFCRKISV